jgi:hypothetical protein
MAHDWKRGASWHCANCDKAVMHEPVSDGNGRICAICADEAENSKEWADAIAAKNGK